MLLLYAHHVIQVKRVLPPGWQADIVTKTGENPGNYGLKVHDKSITPKKYPVFCKDVRVTPENDGLKVHEKTITPENEPFIGDFYAILPEMNHLFGNFKAMLPGNDGLGRQ